MDVTQWIAAGIAVAGALGTLITAWSTRRKASADAVTAVTGMFKELCESQAATIERLERRIADNEQEISELRQALEEARERERGLQERIKKLEDENAALRVELEERRKQTGRR